MSDGFEQAPTAQCGSKRPGRKGSGGKLQLSPSFDLPEHNIIHAVEQVKRPPRRDSLRRIRSSTGMTNFSKKFERTNIAEERARQEETILPSLIDGRGSTGGNRVESQKEVSGYDKQEDIPMMHHNDSSVLEQNRKPSRQRSLMRRSISGPIAKMKRKSWLSTSSSTTSYTNDELSEKANTLEYDTPNVSPKHYGTVERFPAQDRASQSDSELPNGFSRRNSLLRRKSWRPLSTLMSQETDVRLPAVPQIPRSFTDETLSSVSSKKTDVNAPAMPPTASVERLPDSGIAKTRRKDELWGLFRDLDHDYQKFQSKPNTAKTAVIRSGLLPFLRNNSRVAPNLNLRPEHLDRRTVILNKWWTGIIEMLNGRHGESVSGNDRPAVLEAATGLMTRPEWTAIPSRPSKVPRLLPKSRSTTSLGSNMSDFLTDSVHHNVRNLFAQNLLAQMAYVVDKMSLRNVAASVVNFCGKATAYAFFYCEGIAEILVRLWDIQPRTLRQILAQSGFTTFSRDDDSRDKVVSAFPYSLHPLSFKAIAPMVRHLRTRPHSSAAISKIPWYGPWVGRWAGRDTDLFYIFVKVYVDLACRLLPGDVSREARLAAPGWVLVHAQLLKVLECTLKRWDVSLSADPVQRPLPVTFDTILGESEAAAPSLPLASVGLHRSMAENRLIMLLRDCLSSSNFMDGRTQQIFAESVDLLLKAAANATSIFDHDACFILCDFLEEAIPILNRYQLETGSLNGILDWTFWLEVDKRFLESQNSLTEVRLFAFIYSMWGVMTNDAQRKRNLTCGWLLDRKTFHQQFNHWCPMVRAFYMRLLIWRIGRLDAGDGVDKEIINTLHYRLQETWSHYINMQSAAERHSGARISTAPCSPAPSRCLTIMRDDVQPAQSGMFLSFDGILSSSATTKANPYEKHSSPDFAFHSEDTKNPQQSTLSLKESWVSLKNMLFSNNPSGRTANAEDQQNGDIGRTHIIEGNSSPSKDLAKATNPLSNAVARLPNEPTYRVLSFKFSLEWQDKERRWAGREMRLISPKIPPFVEGFKLHKQPQDDLGEAHSVQDFTKGPGTYTGRALAEWTLAIAECQNFIEKRIAEGVPSIQSVETPMLSVDPFRKP